MARLLTRSALKHFIPFSADNDRLNEQVVPHVHFHFIPKPADSAEAGLVIGWPTQEQITKEEIKAFHEDLLTKL